MVRFFVGDVRTGKKRTIIKADADLVITDILISTFEQTEFFIWVDKELVFKHYIDSYSPLVLNLKSGWMLQKDSTLAIQIKNAKGRINLMGYRQ